MLGSEEPHLALPSTSPLQGQTRHVQLPPSIPGAGGQRSRPADQAVLRDRLLHSVGRVEGKEGHLNPNGVQDMTDVCRNSCKSDKGHLLPRGSEEGVKAHHERHDV